MVGENYTVKEKSMCEQKYSIGYHERIGIEGEEDPAPYGTGPDSGSQQRAGGGFDGSSDPVSATPNSARPIPTSCKDIPSNVPNSFKVSKHFTVASLSTRAALPHTVPSITRKGLSRAEVICNMRHLAVNCLDPLRDFYQKQGITFTISSAFRNQTNGSDHNIGAATDLMFFRDGKRLFGRELSKICKTINEELQLPFTQMIHEKNRIIHIACRSARNGGRSATPLYWSTGWGSPVSGRGYRHNV